MSSQSHRDIASFFRPYARTIPQKRPSNDDETDYSAATRQASDISTPRKFKDATLGRSTTPLSGRLPGVSSKHDPIATPKSGKSVSVAFRSPVLAYAGTPTPAQRKPLVEVDNKQKTLFSSNISSLSFTDLKPASRKVVKDGMIMAVQDSDDDETSSLDSLADIFERKPEVTPKTSPSDVVEDNTEAERLKLLKRSTHSRSEPIVGKDKLRALFAREKSTSFDFGRILDEHLEDQDAEQNIAKARAEYDTPLEGEKEEDQNLNSKFLSTVLNHDEDDENSTARLMTAVERTDAFAVDKTFHFFDPDNFHKWSDSHIPGTSPATNDDPKHEALSHLAGYMCEEAAKGIKDDSTLKGMFELIAEESSTNLRTSYQNCLGSISSTWTRANLTAVEIQTIFRKLNADAEILRDGHQIRSQYGKPHQIPRRLLKCLVSVLELFSMICNDLDFSALSKLCSLISRLCLDRRAMSNPQTGQAAEKLLEKLCNIPEVNARCHVHERILSDLTCNLSEASLQTTFLVHLQPNTVFSAQLRNQLAFQFLLGVQDTVKEGDNVLDHLSKHIAKSNTFSEHSSHSRHVDYTILTDLVSVLDIAVADGHRPNSFASVRDESEFNASVDRFTDRLHAIFVSIEDTGASHMRRTEAKDALQMLEYRIMYSVRTKPRKKKHVFDGETGRIRDASESEQELKSKDFMSRFLKKDIFYDTLD